MSSLRGGSLFAGIGGFDLGFEQVGIQTVWQVEIDDRAREVLAAKFPNAKRYKDIREVDDLEPVDIVCGGFPCQDVSVAGRRAGMAEGTRSNLFYEACRVLGGLLPRWLVIENVPGLFSSRRGRDFYGVLSALDELGYGLSWRVLDSQYFGVAQRRRRVFIVGYLGAPCPPEILFEPESLRRDTAPVRTSGKAAPTLFASGAGTDRTASAESESEFCIEVAATLSSGGHPNSNAPGRRKEDDVNLALCLNSRMDRNEPHAETLIEQPISFPSMGINDSGECGLPMLRVCNPSAVCIPIKECQANQWGGVCGPGIGDDGDPMYSLGATPSNMHGIYQWASGGGDDIKDTAQALRSEAEHSYQFLTNGVRRLTPVECARLQGFPDDWNDGHSDSTRYRQFGNAVTTTVAKWIGSRIVAHEARKAA